MQYNKRNHAVKPKKWRRAQPLDVRLRCPTLAHQCLHHMCQSMSLCNVWPAPKHTHTLHCHIHFDTVRSTLETHRSLVIHTLQRAMYASFLKVVTSQSLVDASQSTARQIRRANRLSHDVGANRTFQKRSFRASLFNNQLIKSKISGYNLLFPKQTHMAVRGSYHFSKNELSSVVH